MRQFLVNSLFEIAVRARKSPWIETEDDGSVHISAGSGLVRARGLKLSTITHSIRWDMSGLVRARGLKPDVPPSHCNRIRSGLVRARGLKPITLLAVSIYHVRARKSPWIETSHIRSSNLRSLSWLVRARGLKPYKQTRSYRIIVRARKSPWIET